MAEVQQPKNITMQRVYKFLLEPFVGNDGNLSIRRILAIVFTGVLYEYVKGKQNPDYKVILALGTLVILLLGLATVQNIVEISKKSNIVKQIVENEGNDSST